MKSLTCILMLGASTQAIDQKQQSHQKTKHDLEEDDFSSIQVDQQLVTEEQLGELEASTGPIQALSLKKLSFPVKGAAPAKGKAKAAPLKGAKPAAAKSLKPASAKGAKPAAVKHVAGKPTILPKAKSASAPKTVSLKKAPKWSPSLAAAKKRAAPLAAKSKSVAQIPPKASASKLAPKLKAPIAKKTEAKKLSAPTKPVGKKVTPAKKAPFGKPVAKSAVKQKSKTLKPKGKTHANDKSLLFQGETINAVAKGQNKNQSLSQSIAQAEAELQELTTEANNANQEIQVITSGKKDEGIEDSQAVVEHQQLMEATQQKIIEKKKKIAQLKEQQNKLEEQAQKAKQNKLNIKKDQLKTKTVLAVSQAEQSEIEAKHKSLSQEEPLSKEDQEEQANAKILEANDAKIANNEAALKKDIEDTEQHKADLDEAHRNGSSEELQPTIKKAESERKKMEKKVAETSKKTGEDNTKLLTGEAKATDTSMKAGFPNVAAGESIKAFSPKAALAQKTQNKKVIKLNKDGQNPVKLNQKEEEMSKEDQEEQADAKIREENDAKIAKNEEALRDAIANGEKNTVDVIEAHRDGSSEGLVKVMKEADEDLAKTEKKEEKKSEKFKKDYTKTQITEAKKADGEMKKEFKNEAAAASIKAFGSKASLAQKTLKKKVIKLNKSKPVKLNQLEDISKEDQEEQDNAKILEANDAKIAKNEETLKSAIKTVEKTKATNDSEHREGSNEEMIPTIAAAEAKSEEETEKHDAKISKEVDEVAKKQLEEAKKTDATLKKEMEKANPKKEKAAALAQEEPMSKEDQEEQADAKIREASDAKLAKNEEALRDDISAQEKHKADINQAVIEGSSEGLGKVITIADEDRAKSEKKEEKKSEKFKKDSTKEQLEEAKAADKKLAEDHKAAQPPPLKGPAALVQKSSSKAKAKKFDTALKKSGFDEKAKKAAPILKKLSVAEITKMVIEKAKKQKLAQEEPAMSKEDQEEQANAKIQEENDSKIAKNEETLKNAIISEEKHKDDLDQAHRDHSSEELQPTIKKAESERKKMEKKEAKASKKLGDDYTKEQMTEAKATDKAVNGEFKFESAKASIKAFSKGSLAQAEPEVSKEDQEEAAQAIVNAKNEAELKKNEKTLKDQITTNEKNKAALDAAKREGGNEGLAPTIVKADKENDDAIKKSEEDSTKEGKKRIADQVKAAKAVDKTVNGEYKNVAAKASLKAFAPAKAALAQAEPELSLEEEEDKAQAAIQAKEDARQAKAEKDLADGIKLDEDHKTALDAAHRDHSSEELQPTIKKAESEKKKMDKKLAEDSKKAKKANTETLIGNAKEDDDAMKKEFPNVAAGASLKAYPPAAPALTQVDEEAEEKAKEAERMLVEKQQALDDQIKENQELKAKLEKAEKAEKVEKAKKAKEAKKKVTKKHEDNNSLQVEDQNIDGKVNVQDLIAKAVKNAKTKKSEDIFTPESPADDKTSNQEITNLAEQADQKQAEIIMKESEEAQKKELEEAQMKEDEQSKKEMQDREIKFNKEKELLEKQKEERAAEQKKELEELRKSMTKKTRSSRAQKSSKSLDEDDDYEELEGDDISTKKLHQTEFKEKILPKSLVQINSQNDKYLKSRIKDVNNLLIGLKNKYHK